MFICLGCFFNDGWFIEICVMVTILIGAVLVNLYPIDSRQNFAIYIIYIVTAPKNDRIQLFLWACMAYVFHAYVIDYFFVSRHK